MKYECPSCYLQWKDDKNPLEKLCHPLCMFCSLSHSQKELLNWQMDHIESINPDKINLISRHFYRFIIHELELLREKLNEKQ